MIAKITQGASGRDLIRYLFGPGRANEHTDQRVITSGIVMGVEEGRGLTAAEIADLGSALDAANDSYGANPAAGHIWHLSLSVPSGDRHLTDDEWAAIAQRAIEAIGFEEAGLASAAWVAIGHGTSANGNEHVHIAASLVRVDGSRVDVWQSKRTLSRVCAEAETTYGLTPVVGSRKAGVARVDPGRTGAGCPRTVEQNRHGWRLLDSCGRRRAPPRTRPSSSGGSGGAGCSPDPASRPGGRRRSWAIRWRSGRWMVPNRSGSAEESLLET